VLVDKEKYNSDKIIIATGSKTKIPNISGLKKVKFLTNIEALALKKLPESLMIIGGGAIAAEFAQYTQD